MSEDASDAETVPKSVNGDASRGPLAKICFIVGGASLLLAMATDFVSVVSRHVGLQVLGAIEIVEYCIVGAISSALVIATLGGGHAAVHLLTERLRDGPRRVLARLSDLLSALCFFGFLAGDAWLAADVWNRDERSDLLGLPIAPARILWCLSLALACLIVLRAALRPRRQEMHHDA
jgi:TRAP-type C4-dicarboxylate transport system permease small subunit